MAAHGSSLSDRAGATAVRRSLLLDGLRISYLEQGARCAGLPTLVIVHGLMGSAATFCELLHELPPDLHVIALDLPGAGYSERRHQLNASLYAAAAIVRDAIAALGLERTVIVGHSHGGAVGLYLAALEPRLLDGLVLLAPAHPYFRHADQIIRFYLSPLGTAFAHTLPWYPRQVQMAGLRRMAGPQSWDDPSRLTPYRENLQTQGTIPHLLRLLRTWHTDMRELRSLLQAPFRLRTLVLWGDHDRAVPAETAADLMRRLLTGELHILTGVGHRPAEERASDCAAIIASWLRNSTPQA